ncbi:MAG: LssY C-terminal domain-containing protein [Candidatus Acidiferrales bacterium]|jgi:hypothetical protein
MNRHTVRNLARWTLFLFAVLLFLLFGPCARLASARLERGPAPPAAPAANQAAPAIDKSATVPARPRYPEIGITGDQHWVDTGIDLKPGSRVSLTATGTLTFAGSTEFGPEGLPRGFKDLLRMLPDNQAGHGALIGRIGDADVAQPFVVGAKYDAAIRAGGRLWLGINQMSKESADGAYTVTIEVFAPSGSSAPAPIATTIPGVNADLLQNIPRRVSDKSGNPGDLTNFLLIGSEEQVQQIFMDAGWVKVDKDVKGAFLSGLIESLSKESYVQMPMSVLYLFGRPQDYGFAHAEPITVAATRHHLRLWKSSLTLGGQPVWVGAATHDIGFERDKRNNGITHKIDPDVDTEREFVGKSLAETGELSALFHIAPRDAVKDARTATGGSINSNGEVLVMRLAETTAERK